MTCGIYAIVNKVNGKRYIGKSSNIEVRWSNHLSMLRKSVRNKDCNRHLYSSFAKYGECNFGFEYVEVFDSITDDELSDKELFWMDHYKTCDREFGYNLRRDSSTKTTVHDETRKLQSERNSGESNPNFNNKWSDEQKARMSKIAKLRHESGLYYTEETKLKYSEASIQLWKDESKKKQMARKVSEATSKFKIAQYTRCGILVKVWDRMQLIIDENPSWHRIAIYSCCNGHKKTYRNFVWKKVI